MEIFNQIKNIKTSLEARNFIEQRLSQLMNNDKKEIGYNTDVTVYENFVTPNIKINVQAQKVPVKKSNPEGVLLGSIKVDDPIMYWHLMDAVLNSKDPYEAVFRAVRSYFVSQKVDSNPLKKIKKRDLVFRHLSMKKNVPISIKKISKKKIGMCLEKSVAAHNMFKFLGIDSDYVVTGTFVPDHMASKSFVPRPNGASHHSYIIIYPEGRDKYAIIYDAACTNGTNYPMMFYLNDRKRRCLFENKEIVVDNNDVKDAFKKTINIKATVSKTERKYSILKDAYPETIFAKNDKKLALKREQ